MKDGYDLYSRLKQIRRTAGTRGSHADDGRDAGAQSHEQRKNRERVKSTAAPDLPEWRRLGDYTFSLESERPAGRLHFSGKDAVLPRGITEEQLIYFDTETTGLSGAGTMVFLTGTGRVEGERFILRQFFLADYPGESEYLRVLEAELPEDAYYVTYNGKAFDRNILSSRFLLNGMRKNLHRHIDLLYPSRRLFRTVLPSCSLGDIETGILGISRSCDIPGIMVPGRYFDYLASGDHSLLTEVFSHHGDDIYHLYLLLAYMEGLLTDPLAETPADSFELARFLLFRSDPDAEGLLEHLASKGDLRALRELGFHRKRLGGRASARSCWDRLFEAGDPAGGVELAKCLEHTDKDFNRALEVVDAMLKRPLSRELRDDLLYRRRRLEIKINSAAGGNN